MAPTVLTPPPLPSKVGGGRGGDGDGGEGREELVLSDFTNDGMTLWAVG